MNIKVSFKKEEDQTLCLVYNCCGEYGKPFLFISDNCSGTPYFKSISFEFERKLIDIGFNVPMVELLPTCRLYYLPDKGWWNNNEHRWYEKEEWMTVLNGIFSEINEDFKAGKFD